MKGGIYLDNAKKRDVKDKTPLNINLKEIRESKGVTQKEVALALGMKDNRMINWYENTGAMPPYEKLVALAEFYNVSLDELFGVSQKGKTKKDPKKDVLYNKDKVVITSHLENNTVSSCITRSFHIEAKSLNKKRIDTLKILLEEPTLLDAINTFLKHK